MSSTASVIWFYFGVIYIIKSFRGGKTSERKREKRNKILLSAALTSRLVVNFCLIRGNSRKFLAENSGNADRADEIISRRRIKIKVNRRQYNISIASIIVRAHTHRVNNLYSFFCSLLLSHCQSVSATIVHTDTHTRTQFNIQCVHNLHIAEDIFISR